MQTRSLKRKAEEADEGHVKKYMVSLTGKIETLIRCENGMCELADEQGDDTYEICTSEYLKSIQSKVEKAVRLDINEMVVDKIESLMKEKVKVYFWQEIDTMLEEEIETNNREFDVAVDVWCEEFSSGALTSVHVGNMLGVKVRDFGEGFMKFKYIGTPEKIMEKTRKAFAKVLKIYREKQGVERGEEAQLIFYVKREVQKVRVDPEFVLQKIQHKRTRLK